MAESLFLIRLLKHNTKGTNINILYIALPNQANKCMIYGSLVTHRLIAIYNDYNNVWTDIYSSGECAQKGNIIYTDNHTFFLLILF